MGPSRPLFHRDTHKNYRDVLDESDDEATVELVYSVPETDDERTERFTLVRTDDEWVILSSGG